MHTDRAVHTIVHNNHDRFRLIAHGGSQLLAVHHKVTIAAERDSNACGINDLGSNGGGQSIAH